MADKVYLSLRTKHTYTLTPCDLDAAYAAASSFYISEVTYPKTDADVELERGQVDNAGTLVRVKNGVATIVVENDIDIIVRPDDDRHISRIVKKLGFVGDYHDDEAKEAGLVVTVIKTEILSSTIRDAK